MAESKTVASGHFPQIVWRDGTKFLWNPIHRKALKNLPEERVRLRVLEYLVQGGWSKHRISTEEAIDFPRQESALRTDLICYTQEFVPHLLVECKAENVKLSEKTAQQIARYNQQVSAPYLLMTNGRTDYWYSLNGPYSSQKLHQIPDSLPNLLQPQTDFNYWQDRGFAGENAAPDLRLWITKNLDRCFKNASKNTLRYLSFTSSPSDIKLDQYYRIFPYEGHLLAMGFTATEFGGSRLIGILNQNGKNVAVLEINLDFVFDNCAPNASVYWSGDTQNFDIRTKVEHFHKEAPELAQFSSHLSSLMMNMM